MSISFYGMNSNPTDNNSFESANQPCRVTPPTGMTSGQLAILICTWGLASKPVSLVNDGQTWNSGNYNSAGHTNQLFWCKFNGTWSANPGFGTAGQTSESMTAALLVYSSSLSNPAWSVDTAEVDNLAGAPASPYDCTITGQSPTATSVLTLAWWIQTGKLTNQLRTSGWTNPAATAQIRNTSTVSGTYETYALAHQIQYGANAPSGNVTQRQLTGAQYSYYGNIITFTDGDVAPVQALLSWPKQTFVSETLIQI